MLRTLRQVVSGLAALLGPALAPAVEAAKSPDERLHGLGLSAEQVGAPGLGRVLLVFLLVAALAFCVSWALRRYGFRFRSGAVAGASSIRPLARNTLPGGVVCHLVETQGKQVLITISRNGIDSLLLGESPPAPPPESAK